MEENNKGDNKSNKQDKSSEGETKANLYKTELCKKFKQYGFCKYGDKCQFAHGPAELRPIVRHPKYKTEKCKSFWSTGSCRYGTRCKFLHNEASKNTPENEEHSTIPPQSNPIQYCFPPPPPPQQNQTIQIVSPPPYIEQVPSPNLPMPIQYVDTASIYYPESEYDFNQPINPSAIPLMRKISPPERVINAYTWDQVTKASSPMISPNETNSPIPTSLSDPRLSFMPGRKNNIPTEELRSYIPISDNEKINSNSLRKTTWNGEMVYDLNDKENRKSTWPITKADEDQLNVKISGLSIKESSNTNCYENDENFNRLPVFTKLSNEHNINPDLLSCSQSNISETTCSTITTQSFE